MHPLLFYELFLCVFVAYHSYIIALCTQMEEQQEIWSKDISFQLPILSSYCSSCEMSVEVSNSDSNISLVFNSVKPVFVNVHRPGNTSIMYIDLLLTVRLNSSCCSQFVFWIIFWYTRWALADVRNHVMKEISASIRWGIRNLRISVGVLTGIGYQQVLKGRMVFQLVSEVGWNFSPCQ